MEETDQELLREFAARRCEKSFRRLLDRHVGMVFSVAHRVTGDQQLAEDVAQTTFTTLAEKAEQIESTEALAGWLYHTARHQALRAIRSEQRRRQREQVAVTMNTDEPDPGVVTEHLESAMDQLKPDDRDALVLRFFEDRNLRDVGHELGLSEDAARMRVNRSLEKLRNIFGKLGITGTTTWLASALPTSTTAATIPTGLSASIATTVLGGTAIATTAAIVTQTTSSTMNLFNLKTTAAVVAAAAITGTSTYLVKENEVEELQTEQTVLANDYAQLAAQHEQAMALVQSRDTQIQVLTKDVADVPRLRGEVDRLNRSVADLQILADENLQLRAALEELKNSVLVGNQISGLVPPGKMITRELLSYVGYETPEAAVQTAYWAMVTGNLDEFLNSIATTGRLKLASNSAEQFETAIQVMGSSFQAVQVLGRKNIDSDHAELKIRLLLNETEEPVPAYLEQQVNAPGISIEMLVRENGQWKVKPKEAPMIPRVAEWSQSGEIVHYAN